MPGGETKRSCFWHYLAMQPNQATSSTTVTVLYDGACPLCRREISVYRGLTSSQPVSWCDVNQPHTTLPDQGERADYLARFHVQLGDGTLLSGAAAFVALWSVLPGWRWLARLGKLPGMLPIMEWAYCKFLRFRPTLQRAVRWVEARQS